MSQALALDRCRLRTLSLAGNGCAVVRTVNAPMPRATAVAPKLLEEGVAPPHPMLFFCEAIRENRSLTKLDLHGCMLSAQAAICLEAALMRHQRIVDINLSSNAIGEIGLRA